MRGLTSTSLTQSGMRRWGSSCLHPTHLDGPTLFFGDLLLSTCLSPSYSLVRVQLQSSFASTTVVLGWQGLASPQSRASDFPTQGFHLTVSSSDKNDLLCFLCLMSSERNRVSPRRLGGQLTGGCSWSWLRTPY